MVRPVIKSEKHIVQFSIATVTGGANLDRSIVSSVAVSAKTDPDEVEEGAIIKACYLEFWVRAGSTTPSSGQWVLYKKSQGQAVPTTANMAALNGWSNKKNILQTGMGLFNDQDADAIAIVRGWYKIPKGKQRFGLGDELQLTIFSPTIDLQICGFALYKEYT